jgi:hypothetical protein
MTLRVNMIKLACRDGMPSWGDVCFAVARRRLSCITTYLADLHHD